MKSSKRSSSRIALFIVVLAVLAFGLFRAVPIAAAPSHARVAPAEILSRPDLKICWAEFARNEAWGQLGSAGVTHAPRWDVTISGLVVEHPRGTVVIDIGSSSHFHDEIKDYGPYDHAWLETLPGSSRILKSAPVALRDLGVDPENLFGIIASHAHPDHIGGAVDLPHATLLMPHEEREFSEDSETHRNVQVIQDQAKAIHGRVHDIVFKKTPYETFDESADIFGDGSVVVVKLFGHTPGSIGTFVNVSSTLRIFHVGDAVNLSEAVDRRLTKGVVMASTDENRSAADAAVSRITQMHQAAPNVIVLPAHDRSAWQRIFGADPRCISSR
ncbi:MAG: MBL fold metallo-hydrolase [Polyangiaceae bacterium]